MAADDDKARLARRGLNLIDAADPDEIKARLRGRAAGAARGAVLSGLEVLADLTGAGASDDTRLGTAPAGASADVAATLQSLDDQRGATFDARLRAAAAEAATKDDQRAALRSRLVQARRSFPEASKQFAVLIFACVELLDDLQDHAEGRQELAPAELERREQLLARISALLVPNGGEALASFVEHVVQTSRMARSR